MSKCEFVLIGKDRMRNDSICGYEPRTSFKTLGVQFSTAGALVHEYVEPKIRRIRDIMNMWKGRELSIKGRITLIKSLMASQFTYLASVLVLPQDIIKRIEKELSNFLWKGKPPKVKKKSNLPTNRSGRTWSSQF